MNIQIRHIEHKSVRDMNMSYAECRRRLWAGKSPEIPGRFRMCLPSWMVGEVHFDAHVDAWRLHLLERRLPGGFLKRRAYELGFDHDAIVGSSRKADVVAARHRIMWEIKQAYPHLSYPQIGRLFSRDHATTLNAINKMERLMGCGQ